MAYDDKKDYSIQEDNEDFKQEKLAQDRYLNEGGNVESTTQPVDVELYLSGFYFYKDTQKMKAAGQRRDQAEGVAMRIGQWIKGAYERIVDGGKSLRRKLR